MLHELDFQPNLAGMIVVIERKWVLHWLEKWFDKGNEPTPTFGEVDFSWFDKQNVPYVIAAAGYQGAVEELEQLRAILGLATDIPTIPGAPLSQWDSLSFDTNHANHVLDALHEILKSQE